MTIKPLRLADGEAMRPVPIKLADYVESLYVDASTPENKKQANLEALAILTVMERNLAVLVPKRIVQGRTVWEIQYPPRSLFLNGPPYQNAWGAIQANYFKNGKFSKILAIENSIGSRGELVKDIQKITDASVESGRKAAYESTKGESA